VQQINSNVIFKHVLVRFSSEKNNNQIDLIIRGRKDYEHLKDDELIY